ncbi:MAG: ferredoxin family protein [Bacillota bacterium]|nr:ferredoxin family protein [Bacillota bacterium]
MIQLSFQKERCKGCGFCIEFCPKKILEFSQEMNNLGYRYALVKDLEKCTGCGICASMCPEVIIEVKEV